MRLTSSRLRGSETLPRCSPRSRCPRANAADALDGVAHDVARTLRRGELGVGCDVDLRQAVEQVPCVVARLNGGPCPQYGILVQEGAGHSRCIEGQYNPWVSCDVP